MFDVQLFGSNDTVTSSREGKIVLKFYDGDTRTLSLEDPKNNLKASDIKTFISWSVANQPVIGDKTGASLVGAESCEIVEVNDLKLDLS